MRPAIHIATKTLLFAGLASLAACGGAQKESQGENAQGRAKGFKTVPAEAGSVLSYAPIAEPNMPLGLGFGVDLNNSKGFPGTCVEGTVQVVPNQESFLSLDADFSTKEIEEALGIQADLDLKFLKWGASARGTFAHKARTTNDALNYIVFLYNKHQSKVFVPSGRSEHMKEASKEEWLQRCGSGYVAAQDYGSMLIVKFSLRLENEHESQNWGGNFNGNYLSFAKLQAAISKNNTSDSTKGSLSISALQIGGKPAELGKILGAGSDSGVIESFQLCSDVSQVDECLKRLGTVENYLRNEYPNQFSEPDSANVLTTYPFIYPKSIGADHNPGVEQYVLKARKDLTRLYEDEMKDILTLQRYAAKDDSKANAILQQATKNVDEIRSATELCYETASYKSCAQRAAALAIACAGTIVPKHLGSGSSGRGNAGSDEHE